MAKAKITLLGMNNYMIAENDDLFAFLSLPTGIDKNTLVNNILLRGSEFEILYSNPYYMQNMIQIWSNKWQRTFEKWSAALSINYNPLENYDRMEDWVDNTSNNESVQRQESAIGNDYSNSSGNGTTTNTVSAYDSTSYQPHDQSVSDSSGVNLSSSLTSTDGNTSINTNEAAIHAGRLHGNIGVTTSQQMLQAELDISKWNIYEQITDLFLTEFCIYTY